MEKFRVIVAGGRDFNDYTLLREKLDFYLRKLSSTHEIVIICGKARGADSLGEQYAIEHGYSVDAYPADWVKHGKSAGYIRNTIMAENADALVAFWDGQSRGTKHMIETAHKKNLKVRVVNYG